MSPARTPVELGRLHLTWSYGLITSTEEHPVDAPLGELPEEPAAAAAVIEDPRDEWNSLDKCVRRRADQLVVLLGGTSV